MKTKDEQTFLQMYGWAISMALWGILGITLVVQHDAWRETSLALLVGYAAFSFAGLLGFLFGIPGEGTAGESTHLEKIADWFTKILLGAGLVEMKEIGGRIGQFATKLGPGLSDSHGYALALAIIVSATSLGVLTGYLWSQFHFKRLR